MVESDFSSDWFSPLEYFLTWLIRPEGRLPTRLSRFFFCERGRAWVVYKGVFLSLSVSLVKNPVMCI